MAPLLHRAAITNTAQHRQVHQNTCKRRRSDLVHISSIDVKQSLTDKRKVLVPERRKRLEMSDATRPLIQLDCTEIQLHTTPMSFTSITLPSLFVPGHLLPQTENIRGSSAY